MPVYPQLTSVMIGMTAGNSAKIFREKVIPHLIDVWLTYYESLTREAEIIETKSSDFSYLFDIAAERLIAAWGISKGRHGAQRDRSRMAGHPLSAGPLYHRGHAIPHTLGGPTDINLVPQRGSVNVGAFRPLERKAVATPNSLYFTHWMYSRSADQKPVSVEQGLLIPGRPPNIRTHPN